jgi:hypothetical protein
MDVCQGDHGCGSGQIIDEGKFSKIKGLKNPIFREAEIGFLEV